MADFSQGNARELFLEGLRENGLQVDAGFADEAWNKWLDNPNDAEFAYWLRSTQPYKDAFPYAADLRAKGIPFKEANAVTYKRQARQLFHMVGLPDTYSTDTYINNLIAGDVSFQELQARVTNNLAEYENAPEEIKAEFRSQLGDDSAVVAYYMDPQHTQQNFAEIKAAASVRGYGKRFGFDNIDTDFAKRYGYNLSDADVQQRLQSASQLESLTRRTFNEAPGTANDTTLLKATFTGDTRQLERQAERRNAEFADMSGGYSAGAQTGFGAAR